MVPSGSSASTIFRRALFATTAVLGVAALGGVAHADIMFSETNSPQTDEQTIQFEQFTNMNSFFGDTNKTQTPIEFNLITGITTPTYPIAGESMIGTDAKGQADIVCNAGCGPDTANGRNGMQVEDLEIKMGAGFGATDFIGNLDAGEGTFDINVLDQMGHSFDYVLGNGSNFFTLTATNGEVITDIQILPEAKDGNGNIGFDDFKQPRVSGVCTLVGTTCTAIPIPEPSSLALLGAGLFAAGWFSTRRKSGSRLA